MVRPFMFCPPLYYTKKPSSYTYFSYLLAILTSRPLWLFPALSARLFFHKFFWLSCAYACVLPLLGLAAPWSVAHAGQLFFPLAS